MKYATLGISALVMLIFMSCSSKVTGQMSAGQNVMGATEITVKGKDAFIMLQKNICGTTEEGVTRYGVWEGRAYSRVQGEKDRHIFNLVGLNTRQCNVVEDAVKGKGFKSVSREIMIYMDPKTNEILDTWMNPWLGREVDVLHVANDPVNMRGILYEKNDKGEYARTTTIRDLGDIVAGGSEIPLFYENPLNGEYQGYVGGAYHAMEIFNTFWDKDEMMNPDVKTITQSTLSWSRVAQWLPWMEMGSKPGLMIFNTTGFSTFDRSRVFPILEKVVAERFPTYLDPPPKDDNRANETSWTVFQKHMADKEKINVRSQGVEGHH